MMKRKSSHHEHTIDCRECQTIKVKPHPPTVPLSGHSSRRRSGLIVIFLSVLLCAYRTCTETLRWKRESVASTRSTAVSAGIDEVRLLIEPLFDIDQVRARSSVRLEDKDRGESLTARRLYLDIKGPADSPRTLSITLLDG